MKSITLLALSVLFAVIHLSCSKQEKVGQPRREADAELSESKVEPLIINEDFTPKGERSLQLKVAIYEAELKPIGEFYTKLSELKDATLLAELTVLNSSGEESKLEDRSKSFLYSSIVIEAQEGGFADIELSITLAGKRLDPKFFLKYGGSHLMEVSKLGSQNKVYVYAVSIEKHGDEDE